MIDRSAQPPASPAADSAVGVTPARHRFYCPDLAEAVLSDDLHANPVHLTLDREQAHHARRVLRLVAGQTVELIDGRGRVAQAIIEPFTGKHAAVVRLTEVRHVKPMGPQLDLAVAMPKGPRAVDMVNQVSQLGVDRLIPLVCHRRVVDPGSGKLERLARAAIESAKQCGRAHLMRIEPPTAFDAVLREHHDLRLIAHRDGPRLDLAAALANVQRLLVLIGPEGGWTDAELALAQGCQARRWALGPHILRIETAACAAVAILRHDART